MLDLVSKLNVGREFLSGGYGDVYRGLGLKAKPGIVLDVVEDSGSRVVVFAERIGIDGMAQNVACFKLHSDGEFELVNETRIPSAMKALCLPVEKVLI